MGNAPIIVSKGKSFPVEKTYTPVSTRPADDVFIEKTCCRVITRALLEDDGDVLVFLPGVKEIQLLKRCLKNQRILLYSFSFYMGNCLKKN